MKIVQVRRLTMSRHDPGIVQLWVRGETPLDELARRPYRPVAQFQRAAADALFDVAVVPTGMVWVPNLHCWCGCYAGFQLTGVDGAQFLMLLDPEGDAVFLDACAGMVANRYRGRRTLLAGGEHMMDLT